MRRIHAPGRREAQAKKKLEAEERPKGGRGLGRDRTFRTSVNRGGPFGAPSRKLPDAMQQMRDRRTLIAANSNDDNDTDNDDWSDEDGGAVSSFRLWHL